MRSRHAIKWVAMGCSAALLLGGCVNRWSPVADDDAQLRGLPANGTARLVLPPGTLSAPELALADVLKRQLPAALALEPLAGAAGDAPPDYGIEATISRRPEALQVTTGSAGTTPRGDEARRPLFSCRRDRVTVSVRVFRWADGTTIHAGAATQLLCAKDAAADLDALVRIALSGPQDRSMKP